MFFIGQNLKHVLMTYSFLDLLLINSTKYLLFGVYFSLYQRNTVYEYKLQRKRILKEIQIVKEHIGQKGLHLNPKGKGRPALNFIPNIRGFDGLQNT